MTESNEYIKVSTQEVKPLNDKDRESLDRVFQFTIDSFRDTINLSQVAVVACMSVPAFFATISKVLKGHISIF